MDGTECVVFLRPCLKCGVERHSDSTYQKSSVLIEDTQEGEVALELFTYPIPWGQGPAGSLVSL